MITFTPEQVKEKFGSFSYEGILTIADLRKGRVEIVETFGYFPGSGEWTAINRCRSGGVIENCELYGKTTIYRARIGESPVRFGPVDYEQGGQALEGVLIEDGLVRTKWAGIAGAGLNVAASLPQAPGVICACYPTEEDLKAGGKRTNRVEIMTPLYEKLSIGIDDTDDPEGGATWALALSARQEAARLEGVEPLMVRLAQLYPKSPFKTTNCTSTVITFAVKPDRDEELISTVADFVKSHTRSPDTGIVVFKGIGIPEELVTFGWEAKRRIISLDEVSIFETFEELRFVDVGEGIQGRIGALAAIGLSEEREAAALYGDPALERIRR